MTRNSLGIQLGLTPRGLIDPLPHHCHRLWSLWSGDLSPSFAPHGIYFDRKTRNQFHLTANDTFWSSIDFDQEARYSYVGFDGVNNPDYTHHMDKSLEALRLFYLSNIRSYDNLYSRQSKNIDFVFDENPVVGAHVETQRSKSQNNNVVTINRGFVYALDDLSHTVFADPHPPLFEAIGKKTNWVMRDANYVKFDIYRYWDYTIISKAHSKYNLPLSIFFKFISFSAERQCLADFCTTIALYWIMAHEDAHVYLGHTQFFGKSLGIKGDERSLFDELYASESQERFWCSRAAELDADRNASARIVDEFFDLGYLRNLPVSLNDELEDHFIIEAKGNQLRQIYLLRLIVIGVVLALLIMERATYKGGGDSRRYPIPAIRIKIAIAELLSRMAFVSYFGQRQITGMKSEEMWDVAKLVCYDIEMILDIFEGRARTAVIDREFEAQWREEKTSHRENIYYDVATFMRMWSSGNTDDAIRMGCGLALIYGHFDSFVPMLDSYKEMFLGVREKFWQLRTESDETSMDRLNDQLMQVFTKGYIVDQVTEIIDESMWQRWPRGNQIGASRHN